MIKDLLAQIFSKPLQAASMFGVGVVALVAVYLLAFSSDGGTDSGNPQFQSQAVVSQGGGSASSLAFDGELNSTQRAQASANARSGSSGSAGPTAISASASPTTTTPGKATAESSQVAPTAETSEPTTTTGGPQATDTPAVVVPTNTPVPNAPTATSVPPTNTSVPPTSTFVPPTNTPVPPTATNTQVPPTATTPPTNPQASVSPSLIRPGDTITATLSGFPPNTDVSITYAGTSLATVTTNQNGGLSYSYTVPSYICNSGGPFSYHVTLNASGGGASASASFTLEAPAC